MYESVHTKALQRAAEILGGKDQLREYLRVPASHLTLWLSGAEKPPLDVFLRVVDLLSDGLPGDKAPSTAELVKRARKLRRESSALRAVVSRTRERAERIRASILTVHRLAAASNHPRSALAFLNRRFEADEGPQLMEGALEASIGAVNADKGTVHLTDTAGLVVVAQRGFEPPLVDRLDVVADGPDPWSAALRERRRVLVADVASHPLVAGTPLAPVMARAGVRALQATPVLAESGEALAVISTHFERPREPTERQLRIVDDIARRAAFWLEGGWA
ncbi:MAG TPA: GAF domain-containing protein [Burkholderiales bacterium]